MVVSFRNENSFGIIGYPIDGLTHRQNWGSGGSINLKKSSQTSMSRLPVIQTHPPFLVKSI